MDRAEIIASAERLTQASPSNYIAEEIALNPNSAGMKIFDSPIFAFGSADDELYLDYKSDEIIGSHFLTPAEWLPGAKTVISFFLPYSEKIRIANAVNSDWPADEWLHARIEGQQFVGELSLYIETMLREAGYMSLAPSLNARFKSGNESNRYTSNWSERHAAFACGLGTFGLSKGIITEKGICGRFGSVLTELDLPKDSRNYTEVYERCTMCGACVAQCPVGAISIEDGKKHPPCSEFLDAVLEKHRPRYGCGKCQVRVPCESGIPKKRK